MNAIEWTRQGECNQCGECCRQATNLTSQLIPIADVEYGRKRFGEPIPGAFVKGAPVFHVRGAILKTCPELRGDLCGVHDNKPKTCRDLPLTPLDIEALDKCSYTFVHRVTGEVWGPNGRMV